MSEKREVISLHIGQAGCEIGGVCWSKYCLEHGINPDGVVCDPEKRGYCNNFFSSTSSDKRVPRCAFIDLEPSVIDEIRTGHFRKLFSPASLISGKEDAANCFARGYFTLAKSVIDSILSRIQIMANECESLQGFLIYRSFGGGTGSGLGSLLVEQLREEYPKCKIFEFPIFPAPKLSSVILEPYNTALATHESLEYTNGNFILDNEKCYDICDQILNVYSPSYFNINQLIGQIVSGVSSSFRFEGNLNLNFDEMKTNLIPYPRIQYLIISYAPLLSKKQAMYENITENSLLKSCFEPSNQLVNCDVRKGKYMSCSVLFQGDVNISCVHASIASIKANKSVQFVSWCPTIFKVGENLVPPVTLPYGDLAQVNRLCLMMANSTAIKSVFTRINRKFDIMFSKKAFLHWYIAEGLEEGGFQETRLDLAALESDYEEVSSDS